MSLHQCVSAEVQNLANHAAALKASMDFVAANV